MVTFSILSCVLGISVYFVVATVASQSIINGIVAKENDFPYQVAIVNNGAVTCGGSVIDEQYILSAAHCFINRDGSLKGHRFKVLAGTNDYFQYWSPAMKIIVQTLYVPTEYAPLHSNYTGDIAILKLKSPLKFSKHIKKLKVANDKREHYDNHKAKIAGFGWNMIDANKTHETGEMSDLLRYADADILSNSKCREEWGEGRTILDKHICARVKLPALGVCTGDSGGSLVVNGDTVVGVLSESAHGCIEVGDSHPAIYTRVSHFADFIRHAKRNKLIGMDRHELSSR